MIRANAEVRIRRSASATDSYDDYGNPVMVSEPETIHNVLLEWTTSSIENAANYTTSSTEGVVHFVDSDPDIDETDIIVVDGDDYKVATAIHRHRVPANFSLRVPLSVEIERVVTGRG